MHLWELVIAEDRRVDLADAANAHEWVQRQPWWLHGRTVGPWDEETVQRWCLAIRALRSIVRRLGFTKNTRPVGIDPMIADQITSQYLGRLQPYLHRLKPTEGAGLTKATLGGLRLRPVRPALPTPHPLAFMQPWVAELQRRLKPQRKRQERPQSARVVGVAEGDLDYFFH